MSAPKPQQPKAQVIDLMAALKASLAASAPARKPESPALPEPESGSPEAVEPGLAEHVWQEDGEELRATGEATWYREGEDWRRANADWSARYLRQELLRVAARLQELEGAERESEFTRILDERAARLNALEKTSRELAEALEALRRLFPREYQAGARRQYGSEGLSGNELEALDELLRKAGRS